MSEPIEPNIKPGESVTDDVAQRLALAAVKRLSRRGILGGGLVGVATLLFEACSNSNFTGSGSNKIDGANKGATGGSTAGGPGSGPTAAECAANSSKTTCNAVSGCSYDDGKSECLPTPGGASGGATSGATAGGINGSGAGNGTGTGTGSGGGTAGNLGDGSDSSACFANTATQVNVPQAEGDLIPTVKFYGRTHSALVAIQFNSAAKIQQVVLATPNGTLLALHGITGADMKSDGSFRPIVIDNIYLTEAGAGIPTLKILIQTDTETKLHTEPVVFFTKYNGKPVIDLSQQSVPAGFTGNQSVTRFAEGPTFNIDNNLTYPSDYNPGTTRSLHTAKSGSTWTPVMQADGIQGTVTDIMGNTIDVSGSGIIEYQVFCTYVDTGSSVARTILHIG